MRAVVPRVSQASVKAGQETVGSIGPGLLVLLGVAADDAPQDADWMAAKICHLRIFEDEAGKLNRSLIDCRGEMLVVSQFTLYGDCRKGRRPSFVKAAAPETNPSITTGILLAAPASITPASPPISNPPTFARTSTGSLLSG